MPCAPGMAGCRRGCLHRQMVGEYRLARHAAELERERVTGSYETEMSDYPEIVTFKSWLEDMAGANSDAGANNSSEVA